MSCSQCAGVERLFDRKVARREMKRYRKKGPAGTTRILLDALPKDRAAGRTLLDVGGGVGAIQHALAEAGAAHVTNVDAARAYLEATKEEARRQGYADRATYLHGDFVALAPDVPPADIVTLDRVLCCYPDVQALVDRSASHARTLYGVVYPRDTWWLRAMRLGINAVMRLRRRTFRFFVHPRAVVDTAIRAHGLSPRFHRNTLLWQVAVYERVTPDA